MTIQRFRHDGNLYAIVTGNGRRLLVARSPCRGDLAAPWKVVESYRPIASATRFRDAMASAVSILS